jgi:hypothetical protein
MKLQVVIENRSEVDSNVDKLVGKVDNLDGKVQKLKEKLQENVDLQRRQRESADLISQGVIREGLVTKAQIEKINSEINALKSRALNVDSSNRTADPMTRENSSTNQPSPTAVDIGHNTNGNNYVNVQCSCKSDACSVCVCVQEVTWMLLV